MAATSSSIWTHLPPDKSVAPRPVNVEGVDGALAMVVAELRAGCKRGTKDRLDLRSLAAEGHAYAQVEAVPDALFGTLRAAPPRIGVMLLLPPAAGGSTVAGGDAVVLFHDECAPLKGLPLNERASLTAAACGIKTRLLGECIVGRIRAIAAEPALGGETPPQFLVERDWLEAAQGWRGKTSEAADRLVVELNRRLRALSEPAPAAAADPAHSADATDGIGVLDFADEHATVSVTVHVPAQTRARDVRCDIREAALRLEVMTFAEGKRVLVNGPLFQLVDPDGSTWQIDEVRSRRDLPRSRRDLEPSLGTHARAFLSWRYHGRSDPDLPRSPAQAKGGSRLLTISLEKKKPMRWLMLIRDTGVAV